MQISGLQKTTLLDFPGHVAATVFLQGCNFCCPFCHNKDLVLGSPKAFCTEEELLIFLKKRQGILDGVCITGGEPTLHKELFSLIDNIKNLGYLVKLDTNASNPAVLKALHERHMLDYAAIDIKTCKERYKMVCGWDDAKESKLLPLIEESVSWLLEGHIPYEFRTTVVKELHRMEDFLPIGEWIGGCSSYYLQSYKDSDSVISPGFSSYTKDELTDICRLLKPYIPHVEIRGID